MCDREDNADYEAMRGNSLANVHVEDNPEDWADCGICGNTECAGDCMSDAQLDKLDEDDFHVDRFNF